MLISIFPSYIIQKLSSITHIESEGVEFACYRIHCTFSSDIHEIKVFLYENNQIEYLCVLTYEDDSNIKAGETLVEEDTITYYYDGIMYLYEFSKYHYTNE